HPQGRNVPVPPFYLPGYHPQVLTSQRARPKPRVGTFPALTSDRSSASVATLHSENLMSVLRLVISLGLLLGAAVAASHCGTPSPLGVDARAPGLMASGSSSHQPGGDDADDGDDTDEEGDSLVSCRPLPYESVTQTIGPEGGVLEVRRNWLVVTRGALLDTVSFTAVGSSESLAVVCFLLTGLRFLTTVV